jgi:hypothetical protein
MADSPASVGLHSLQSERMARAVGRTRSKGPTDLKCFLSSPGLAGHLRRATAKTNPRSTPFPTERPHKRLNYAT